ncbi:regulator of G-protein signaling [Acrasis kona]|uniref:Regulator of G-protein signaling n=1 Tax=Acrasis kona TaxID=1008807 RepID=A0AAW2ZC17_9EUKA
MVDITSITSKKKYAEYFKTVMNFTNDTLGANTTASAVPQISISVNPLYVVISILVATLGAYTCFSLIQEVRYAKRVITKLIYIFLSCTSLSICSVWAMHFIGTICYSMAYTMDGKQVVVPMGFDAGLTFASAFAAWFLCLIGYAICSVQIFFPVVRKLSCCNILRIRYKSSTQTESISTDNAATSKPTVEKVQIRNSLKNVLNWVTPTVDDLICVVEGNEFKPHIIQVLFSAIFVSGGFLVMHFVGMLATKYQFVSCHLDVGVVAAACVISIVASVGAILISFHIPDGSIQVLLACVAAGLVCSMHYVGMTAGHYHYNPLEKNISRGAQLSMDQVALSVMIAAGATSFFMLLVSSMVSSKRRDMTRLNNKLKIEKEKNRLIMANVRQNVSTLNEMVDRIANEEYQTRKVMNMIYEPICVIDQSGVVIKSNTSFNNMTGMNDESNISACLLDLNDVSEVFKNNITIKSRLQTAFKGVLTVDVQCSVEDSGRSPFCIMFLKDSEGSSNLQKELSMRTACDIDNILSDPDALEKFQLFLRRESCEEPLLFLIDVKRYEKCSIPVERLNIQNEIIANYLTLGSEKQLNLPSQELQKTVKKASGGLCQVDLFSQIVTSVKLMLRPNFKRYLSEKDIV